VSTADDLATYACYNKMKKLASGKATELSTPRKLKAADKDSITLQPFSKAADGA
jgi:hypothetical protein